MFDMMPFLEEFGIDYVTEGKNVSPGWINIQCPFCDDPSEHLGYDPKSGMLSCWRCGSKFLDNLLRELLNTKEVSEILKKYQTEGEAEVEYTRKEKKEINKEVEMPCGAYQPTHMWNVLHNIKDIYAKYLKDRNFTPEDIKREWNLWIGGYTGDYKFRIIIPVYYKHTLMSYVARDITGLQEPKYLNMPGGNIKEYLYGYDHTGQDTVIVVEGVTDVWRLGKGVAVATFGTKTTMAQLILLKKFKRVGVLFDRGESAQEEAEKIINALGLIGIEVHNLSLPEGASDPADMTEVQARMIVKNFFNLSF
jgi:DNA primase